MDTPVIYLDNAATTPLDPRVATAMHACLSDAGLQANPSSAHRAGRAAYAVIEHAKTAIAALIGAQSQNLVLTSGATESINLALRGVAARAGTGHIVTSRIEHPATLETCRALARAGFSISYVEPDSDGIIQPEAVVQALRDDTVLCSVMHVNNEIGTINDIAAIGARVHAHGALFHVDAAQSAGKLALDMAALPVDALSFTAHKMYGPKGVGALYVRLGTAIEPMMHGGGQQHGLRAGTLATHQIVGMGEACRLAEAERKQDEIHVHALRERLWTGLKVLPGVLLNGHREARAAGILNVSFDGIEGESLLLDVDRLAVSTGSACNSATREPSSVLRALGRDAPLAEASLRLSLGRFSTAADVDQAIAIVAAAVKRLRALSPLAS